MNFKKIPLSLKIVTMIFILEGAHSMVELFKTLTSDYHNINFIIAGILIGPGLLTLRNGWRIIALVFLWLVMISIAVITLGILVQTSTPDIIIFCLKTENISEELNTAIAALLFIVSIWQYRVLKQSDIHKLFTEKRGL